MQQHAHCFSPTLPLFLASRRLARHGQRAAARDPARDRRPASHDRRCVCAAAAAPPRCAAPALAALLPPPSSPPLSTSCSAVLLAEPKRAPASAARPRGRAPQPGPHTAHSPAPLQRIAPLQNYKYKNRVFILGPAHARLRPRPARCLRALRNRRVATTDREWRRRALVRAVFRGPRCACRRARRHCAPSVVTARRGYLLDAAPAAADELTSLAAVEADEFGSGGRLAGRALTWWLFNLASLTHEKPRSNERSPTLSARKTQRGQDRTTCCSSSSSSTSAAPHEAALIIVVLVGEASKVNSLLETFAKERQFYAGAIDSDAERALKTRPDWRLISTTTYGKKLTARARACVRLG
jgi:hypothetical protein